MKKLFITALIALSIVTSAFADVKVNSSIISYFNGEYPTATNVSWITSSSFIKASFILNNEKHEAFYSFDGTVIGTSKTFELDKLPNSALRYITKKYPFPPYSLKECIAFTNADNEKKCYVSLVEEGKSKLILEVTEKGAVSIFK